MNKSRVKFTINADENMYLQLHILVHVLSVVFNEKLAKLRLHSTSANTHYMNRRPKVSSLNYDARSTLLETDYLEDPE